MTIENVKYALNECRSGVDNEIYSVACKIAHLVDVTESRPRTTIRQQHRPNIQAQSISDYFRLTVTIPVGSFN